METVTYTNRFGESVTFGGPPFYLQEITGLGDVAAVLQTQKVPYQDGSVLIDTLLEEREIPITFLIVNSPDDGGYEKVSERRQHIASVTNPKLGPGTLRYENDHLVREISCIADSVPIFPDSGGRVKTLQKGTLNFVAPDPYWKEANPTNVKLEDYTGNFRFPFRAPGIRFAVRGDRRTLINEGDSPAPILARFIGNAVNPVLKNETTGEFIKINYTIPDGFEMHISTFNGNKFVELVDSNGTRTNVFHYIDLSSTFFKLQLGENVISFITEGGNPDVYVEFYNQYLAV